MSKATPTICAGCKHAQWSRTAKGALHPSGQGRCVHPLMTLPPKIPRAARIQGSYGHGGGLRLDGGYIQRRDNRFLSECDTFEVVK
jgi:hypothetical protein